MGVAAMTLAGGEYAIHGTNMPGSVGGFVSYGCIRMLNADITDLYGRVSVGHPGGGDALIPIVVSPRSQAILPGMSRNEKPRMMRGFLVSEIRRDALVLPIAIARRLRPLRALKFLRHRLGIGGRGLAARLGFGERALRRRRQRLVLRELCEGLSRHRQPSWLVGCTDPLQQIVRP